MFWTLVLITTVVWFLYYIWKRLGIYKIAAEIPSCMKSYPGVGHAYLMIGDGEDRMNFFHKVGRTALKQGGLSSFWIANKLYVAFADPILAEVIYKNCLDKDDATVKFIRAVTGNGSIFAPVSIWRPRRKIMAPLFNMRNLNQFVLVFSEQSAVMTELLKPMAGAGDFTIWKYLTAYTFDSVCETSLGVKLNTQKQPHLPFLQSFDTLVKIVTERMCSPWLYPDLIFKSRPKYAKYLKAKRVMNEFVDELVKNKRKELAARNNETYQSKPNMSSFLEMMIEQSGGSKGYTNLELREEVLVILIAGTDTSAVGASYVVVMLSRYPDIQEKVFQELHEVFGNSERPVTVEDLPKLKYLDVVIKETLRLYPPVPIILREVLEDVKLPTGTTLVNGVSVVLHIWAMHRNREYWGEDAEQYRPERFLEGPLKNHMQFQPFSYANRNCLGYNYAMMSMKTVLANLLRKYKVLPPSSLDPSQLHEPLRVKLEIMMKPVDNYCVRLENRC